MRGVESDVEVAAFGLFPDGLDSADAVRGFTAQWLAFAEASLGEVGNASSSYIYGIYDDGQHEPKDWQSAFANLPRTVGASWTFPAARTVEEFSLEFGRWPSSEDSINFWIEVGSRWRGTVNWQVMVRLIEQIGSIVDLSYGEMGPLGGLVGGSSRLESVLTPPTPFVEQVRRARRVLRGYSWITICPKEIVERLGGVVHLRETAAFWRVEPLAMGSVLLQATERIQQYDHAAVRRVFEALREVLPQGQPNVSMAARFRLVPGNAVRM